MKTTKADFEVFKSFAQEYLDKLGLKDWSIHFAHDETEGSYALTTTNSSGHVATIILGKYWDDLRVKNDHELRKLALHEVCHVLLAPILKEARERYTTPYYLEDLEHEVIRRLENLA